MWLDDIQLVVSGGGMLLAALTIIQITPIKINPWSYLLRQIGNALNNDISLQIKDLNKKIDHLEKDIESLRADCDEREATLCRAHILRFGDEILHGMKHSHEHFKSILVDIDKYEDYCSTHPLYMNNLAEVTIDLIKRTYEDCFDSKNFL